MNNIAATPTATPMPAFAPVDSPAEPPLGSLPPGSFAAEVPLDEGEEVWEGALVDVPGVVLEDEEDEVPPDAGDDVVVVVVPELLALPGSCPQMFTISLEAAA